MSFFEQALSILVQQQGPLLENVTIVLPDRTALPAFEAAAAAYARTTGQGLLMPNLVTLHTLAAQITGARIPRQLTLLSELHNLLADMEGPLFSQAFDKARPQLEMMLADFDEIDSQLVDVPLLYRSLLEETEITLRFTDYATEEEVAVIQDYWRHFTRERIEQNDRRQLDLYTKLPKVYEAFNQRLKQLGFSYRGAMYREVVRILRSQGWQPQGMHYFVGFNKLSESQLQLAELFVNTGKGQLILDDLEAPTHTTESRFYLQRISKRKGLGPEKAATSSIASDPELPLLIAYQGSGKLLGAQAMARELVNLLREGRNPNSTAAILSQNAEQVQLMQNLLGAEGISTRNLHRMSLASSHLFSLFGALFMLAQKVAGHKGLKAIPFAWLTEVISHPTVQTLYHDEVQNLVERTHEGNVILSTRQDLAGIEVLSVLTHSQLVPAEFWGSILRTLRTRSLAVAPSLVGGLDAAIWALHAIENQMEEQNLRDPWTFWSLFAGELGRSYLPIEEKDAQVTFARLADVQGQDFDLLVFLDANEGSMPAQLPRHSLVPHPFRRLVGMTTAQEDAAQQAYLFFRQLKRAKQALFYINNASDDLQSSEPSRYLEQLKTFAGATIELRYLQMEAQAHPSQPITIEKTPEVLARLERFFHISSGRAPDQLYPTRLSTYLQCPLLFYLQALAGIHEPSSVSEDMDGSRFGNIVHDSMEKLYQPLCEGKRVMKETELQALLDAAPGFIRHELMAQYSFSSPDEIDDLGFVSVSEEVLVETVRRLLERDRERMPFVVEKLESRLEKPFPFTLQVGGQARTVDLNGKFDRVDRRVEGGMLEVVDYKTSTKVATEFKTWDEVFAYSDTKSSKEAFQILVYAWLLHKSEREPVVRPTVVRMNDLYDRTAKAENAFFKVAGQAITSVADVADEIEARLRALLEEIFDPAVPFRQTSQEKACTYCSFAGLCNRTQKPSF